MEHGDKVLWKAYSGRVKVGSIETVHEHFVRVFTYFEYKNHEDIVCGHGVFPICISDITEET